MSPLSTPILIRTGAREQLSLSLCEKQFPVWGPQIVEVRGEDLRTKETNRHISNWTAYPLLSSPGMMTIITGQGLIIQIIIEILYSVKITVIIRVIYARASQCNTVSVSAGLWSYAVCLRFVVCHHENVILPLNITRLLADLLEKYKNVSGTLLQAGTKYEGPCRDLVGNKDQDFRYI